jgi:phosphate starvation-inducible protein PhoH and related proteins|tara:strand:- start:6519 stop:7475 length:957 start_codon:yes stop_codon:yes gene_type:complete
LQEKQIVFDSLNPVEIFGVNNNNVNLLKTKFPKLKLIARGAVLKIFGAEEEIEKFELSMETLVNHYNRYNKLELSDINEILEISSGQEIIEKKKPNDFIVYGTKGEPIRARTKNQAEIVKQILTKDMIFAIGPAGTGKTYTSVALAVKALKEKQVKRIILTRPAVEAGESLGFLPGDLKDKLDPYLQPLYDALSDMLPAEKLSKLIETNVIQITPLGFMRGRTLDNAFVILDEAQNATRSQLKMFLTRMGKSAKFIITGDLTQVDLPKKTPSGLVQGANFLKDVEGIGFVYLNETDVIRHQLVKKIIKVYEKNDANDE